MDCGPLEQHRVIWVMFENMNLFEKYRINMEKFPEFIHEVKRLYNFFGNSYHNYEHGINGIHLLSFKLFLLLKCYI